MRFFRGVVGGHAGAQFEHQDLRLPGHVLDRLLDVLADHTAFADLDPPHAQAFLNALTRLGHGAADLDPADVHIVSRGVDPGDAPAFPEHRFQNLDVHQVHGRHFSAIQYELIVFIDARVFLVFPRNITSRLFQTLGPLDDAAADHDGVTGRVEDRFFVIAGLGDDRIAGHARHGVVRLINDLFEAMAQDFEGNGIDVQRFVCP